MRYDWLIMTAKKELAKAIEAFPEDIGMEEAVQRLYQIYRIKSGLSQDELPARAGAASLFDDLAEIGATAADDLWSRLPQDGARNLDQYLYRKHP